MGHFWAIVSMDPYCQTVERRCRIPHYPRPNPEPNPNHNPIPNPIPKSYPNLKLFNE